MGEETRRNALLSLGALAAAAGASLCCILPVAVAVLGVGSAALGASLEPLRPYLIAVTAIFLGIAFYQSYKPVRPQCAPGQACAEPEKRRTQRVLVWGLLALALALLTFPYYVGRFF